MHIYLPLSTAANASAGFVLVTENCEGVVLHVHNDLEKVDSGDKSTSAQQPSSDSKDVKDSPSSTSGALESKIKHADLIEYTVPSAVTPAPSTNTSTATGATGTSGQATTGTNTA